MVSIDKTFPSFEDVFSTVISNNTFFSWMSIVALTWNYVRQSIDVGVENKGNLLERDFELTMDNSPW